MLEVKKSSYRSIFKATSLFGGVQAYQIFIQVIKSKFIAVLLGPTGVGIIGLYQNGLSLVQQITSMGLAQSAVRDVSEAQGSGDMQRIAKTVRVVKSLVWITGLLGLLSVVIFSPLLSKSSFDKYDYTIPFIILSITLLFDQLSAGQRVVLQGMRRLKDLAKCSAYGATFGLIVSVPLYYWFGVEGIVPTLILTSLSSLLLSWAYSRKIKIDHVKLSTKQIFEHGRMMLVMGVSMSLSGILSTGASYGIRSYIQKVGGLDEVGLFQAGFVIMNTYVGLIMNAIATDYYPRLAAINKDNDKCREAVSQQGEIATMILAPLLTICLVFMPFILKLLYSDRFLAANEYISWACLGMMFRLSSWIIAFMFVAKAESNLYMINEILITCVSTFLSIVGYRYWGLQGVGAAFTITYIIYFIQVYLIARHRYKFRFSSDFLKCYSMQTLLVIICLIVVLITDGLIKYLVGASIICLSTLLGLRGLNQRLDLLSAIKSKFKNTI